MPQLTLDQLFGRAPNKDKRPNDRDKKPGPATVKPAVARASPAPAPPPKKILFGPNGPHVDFDRSSPHPVKYKDLVYPTSQHLFQSFKFHRDHPDIAEQIRLAATAEQAFTIAHSNRESCRSDWSSVNLSKMEEALHLKFLQHPALRQELLGTANAELYQDSTNDVFWGVGSNLLGQNELGRALERVRERLGGAKAAVRKSVPCTVGGDKLGC
ncbi:hypothetical protein C8R46DRAFT_885990 [Mycena filopes]|nr:hypothetical protein C8R46DRAFT_885990 [Mycena filopes]